MNFSTFKKMSKESGAISLLTRAVELDSKNQWTSALVCYKEGLQMLMEAIKTETMDSTKKAKFREKAEEYLKRAETLQKKIDEAKKAGNFHEHIEISENAIGYSYESIFGRFLDPDVTSVHVEDPYVRAHHQIVNFLRLSELLVRKCAKLKKIHLVTGSDTNQSQDQMSKLQEIAQELQQSSVQLTFEISQTLHDRQIK